MSQSEKICGAGCTGTRQGEPFFMFLDGLSATPYPVMFVLFGASAGKFSSALCVCVCVFFCLLLACIAAA